MKALLFAVLLIGAVAGSLVPIMFMESRRWALWTALAIGGSSLAGLVILTSSISGEKRAACEAKGGVLAGQRNSTCVKKDAVIP